MSAHLCFVRMCETGLVSSGLETMLASSVHVGSGEENLLGET